MSRMLIDKSIGYLYNSDKNDARKTIRIFNMNRGLTGSLYDLTYQPTYIINNIYLGNAYNARNYYNLIENNVGLIINCTHEIPDYFKDHFDYHRVDVNDVNGADIYPHLDTTVTKIHDYIENNPLSDVFVHCFMGSSRSAAIVIAYLMKYYKHNLADAVNYVKSRREVVNLNRDFYNQLKKYQNYLRENTNANN